MIKRIILGIFLIGNIFVLNGCGSKNTVDNIVDNNPKDEVEYIKEDCMVWCRMMWNGNANNEWRSKSEMEKDCNSLCEAWEAMQNNDLNACDKSEWIMRDSCISSIAQETIDSKACAKINDLTMKGWCYSSIAEKSKDASICDQIEDSMWKSICEESAK